MDFPKSKRKIIILINITIFVFSSFAGKKGNAFFEFLEDPINSRSIGMGTVGTALPNNGGFSFYNPALSAINKRPYLSFDYGRQYGDLGRANPEFALVSDAWFFGVAFLTQSSGTFQLADERGLIEGATQSDQSSVGVVSGGIKKNAYAFGLSINGIQNKIGEYSSYGVTGSVGAIFNLLPEKLYFGVSVFNFGRNTSFLDSKRSLNDDHLPLTFRSGLSWSDKLIMKYPFTFAVDVVYSKNYEQIIIPVGLEFWIHPALAIRIGKRFYFEDDLFSLGTGLRFDNFGFDAAFTPTRTVSDVEMKWSMGISYYLASPKKKTDKSISRHETDAVKAANDSVEDSAFIVHNDTVPVFKVPVERKIIRKKVIDSSDVLIDPIKTQGDSIEDSKKDSVEIKNATEPQRDTSIVAPAEKVGTEGADSKIDSSAVILPIPEKIVPEIKADQEIKPDSTNGSHYKADSISVIENKEAE